MAKKLVDEAAPHTLKYQAARRKSREFSGKLAELWPEKIAGSKAAKSKSVSVKHNDQHNENDQTAGSERNDSAGNIITALHDRHDKETLEGGETNKDSEGDEAIAESGNGVGAGKKMKPQDGNTLNSEGSKKRSDAPAPVILAGKKETVSLAIQKAERFRTELLRRGVLLVPVIWGEGSVIETEKKGFGLRPKAAAALPSIGEDFDKKAQSIIAKSKLKAEIRFKAEVVSPAEWERRIKDQQKSEVVTPGEDVYIILRLDGRVRRSGKGMPDWSQIVKELPEMEALLSKLER